MNKKLLWIGIALFLLAQFIIGSQVEPDMSHVGADPHKIHSIAGYDIPFGGINEATVFVSWGIIGFIIIVSFFATRKLKRIPGRLQSVFELFLGAFDQLCIDTMGKDRGRKFLPYVGSLFIFICLCNWSGMLGLEEPTRDLNTTLGLGLISFFVSHLAAIRYKGIVAYISEYFEPMIEVKGFKIPNVIFAPLNLVGEIGKLISHSFRLYGNILGGAIIIQVVSALTRFIVLPIGLNLFFGLFVGAVQAFVFAMLALTYIAVLTEG